MDQIVTLAVGIGSSWLRGGNLQEHYNEFYFAAVDYRTMAIQSLHRAELAIQARDTKRASVYIDNSDRYLKLYKLCVDGANAVRAGDLDGATTIARGIYNGSKISSKYVSTFIPGPWASRLVDGLYMATDFLVDSQELSIIDASKNAGASAIADIVLSGVKVPSLGNKSISDAITKQTTELIGSSRLYPTLVEVFGKPETQKQILSFLARSGAHVTDEMVSNAIESRLRELAP